MTFEFTCSATTVDNLYRSPRIEWRYDGSAVSDNGNPQMNSTSGQLIFGSIANENSGDYTCRAIITILESGISEHYGETSTTVNTASKPAIITIIPYPPENKPPSKISPLPSLTFKFLHRYVCFDYKPPSHQVDGLHIYVYTRA